jgi:hypothetical protein
VSHIQTDSLPRVERPSASVELTMAKRGNAAAGADRGIDSERFERTIRKMLSTPPTPHVPKEKTKRAAPKRDPRSSGKGSKG